MRRFIGKLINHFSEGEIALGIHTISKIFAPWFFKFNKATLLYTENFRFPQDLNPGIKVRIADYSDIDEINRISGVASDHIKQMMAAGAVCFMGSVMNGRYSSVAWATFGRSYIRGIGYRSDFGDDSHYTFGLFTLPEARKKGLNSALLSASIKYAIQKDIRKFYSIVEFTNNYALNFHLKYGYEPIGYITYFKLLFLRITIRRDIKKNKTSRVILLREPRSDIIII